MLGELGMLGEFEAPGVRVSCLAFVSCGPMGASWLRDGARDGPSEVVYASHRTTHPSGLPTRGLPLNNDAGVVCIYLLGASI